MAIAILHFRRQSVPEVIEVFFHHRCVSHVCFEEARLDAEHLDSERRHAQTEIEKAAESEATEKVQKCVKDCEKPACRLTADCR